jgi:hypothetical protein
LNYKIIGWASQILRDNPIVSNSFVVSRKMMKPNIITLIKTDMVPQNVVEDITDANEIDEMFVDDLTYDEVSFDSGITEKLTESDENDESEASSDILNESEESTVSSSTDEELPDLTPRTSYKSSRQDVEGMVTRSQVKKLKRN